MLSETIFHDDEIIDALVENIHMVIFAIMCIYAVETCAFIVSALFLLCSAPLTPAQILGIRVGREWARQQNQDATASLRNNKMRVSATVNFRYSATPQSLLIEEAVSD